MSRISAYSRPTRPPMIQRRPLTPRPLHIDTPPRAQRLDLTVQDRFALPSSSRAQTPQVLPQDASTTTGDGEGAISKLIELVKALLEQLLGKGSDANAGSPDLGAGSPDAAPGRRGHRAAARRSGKKAGAGARAQGSQRETATGGKIDGPDGFLFKPQSESDGKLVVLLPAGMKGEVAGVKIKDANGRTLDEGRFSGDDGNGGRPHFRFNKSGGAFPAGVQVEVTLKDGRTRNITIPDPSRRYD